MPVAVVLAVMAASASSRIASVGSSVEEEYLARWKDSGGRGFETAMMQCMPLTDGSSVCSHPRLVQALLRFVCVGDWRATNALQVLEVCDCPTVKRHVNEVISDVTRQTPDVERLGSETAHLLARLIDYCEGHGCGLHRHVLERLLRSEHSSVQSGALGTVRNRGIHACRWRAFELMFDLSPFVAAQAAATVLSLGDEAGLLPLLVMSFSLDVAARWEVVSMLQGARVSAALSILRLMLGRETDGHVERLERGVLGKLEADNASASLRQRTAAATVEYVQRQLAHPDLRVRQLALVGRRLLGTNTGARDVERLSEGIGQEMRTLLGGWWVVQGRPGLAARLRWSEPVRLPDGSTGRVGTTTPRPTWPGVRGPTRK